MKQKEAAEAEVEILLSEKVEIESTLASIDEQIEAGKDEIEEHKATLEEINSQLAEAEKKVQSKTADMDKIIAAGKPVEKEIKDYFESRSCGIMETKKIKNDNENTIGKNIRRLRKEKGLGQTDLVKELQLLDIGITRETLVKIERGIQHIQLAQLKGIKQILDVSYEDLLD